MLRGPIHTSHSMSERRLSAASLKCLLCHVSSTIFHGLCGLVPCIPSGMTASEVQNQVSSSIAMCACLSGGREMSPPPTNAIKVVQGPMLWGACVALKSELCVPHARGRSSWMACGYR